MKVVIEINVDNAAFTEPDPGPEVSRILKSAAEYLDTGYFPSPGFSMRLRDINGNTVGKLEVK